MSPALGFAGACAHEQSAESMSTCPQVVQMKGIMMAPYLQVWAPLSRRCLQVPTGRRLETALLG